MRLGAARVRTREARPVQPSSEVPGPLSAAEVASLDAGVVLKRLSSTREGLPSPEAARRLTAIGPNAVRTHHARPVAILARQFRSALLLLLLVTAVVSAILGERAGAAIIGAILAISVGVGFLNEYRAERAVEALHEEIRHDAPTLRDGKWSDVDVTELVPGDVVRLELGMIVPADLRVLEATNLECDESVLTGEAEPAEKSPAPVAPGLALADLSSCTFMGTIVREGSGQGVVVATGAHTAFGTIALGLGERHPETAFQVGLRRFSALLAKVAAVLTSIFVVNLLLRGPLIDALLFSLAIAVGITPAPAGGGHYQPGHRLQAARPQQGAGEAVGRHRGPRQRGGPCSQTRSTPSPRAASRSRRPPTRPAVHPRTRCSWGSLPTRRPPTPPGQWEGTSWTERAGWPPGRRVSGPKGFSACRSFLSTTTGG